MQMALGFVHDWPSNSVDPCDFRYATNGEGELMGRSHFDPADGPRLMRGILENPADDQPRLSYSDWLEERGDLEQAAIIRLQCEISRLESILKSSKTDEIETAKLKLNSLYDIESQKLISNGYYRLGIKGMNATYVRGFVSEIQLTCEQFLAHAEQLFREHPITRVVLTDVIMRFVNADGIELNGKLPDDLLKHLRYESTSTWLNGRRFLTYDSSEHAAKDALSDACVAYGRQLAELPPLEVVHQ